MRLWMKMGLVLLLLFVAGFSVWRIVALNQEFADWGQEKRYEKDQTVTHNGFEISATDFIIMTREEAVSRYHLDEGELVSYDKPEKVVLFQLRLKNTTDETKKLDITPFVIQTGILTNGLDPNYMLLLNEEMLLRPELGPGEEYSEVLATSFVKIQVKSNEQWDTLEQQKFELVLALDPQKIILKLN